jgi:hypothetical protein
MGDRQDGTEPMTAEVAVMVLNSPTASESLIAEAVATLAQLVSSKVDQWHDTTGQDGNPMAWHFVGYRADSPEGNRDNPPESAQYQGVVFADGTVAMRWLTATRSHSVWDTFADMFDAHGRPEYGTEIHWPDGAPTEARDVIERAAQDYRDRVAAEGGELERQAQLAAEEPATVGGVPLSELPGAVASSPNGWVISSLAELTEDQKAELLATPGALRWTGTHFENVRPIELRPEDGPQ